MNEHLPGSASLSAMQLQRVDEACDRFEAALRAGSKPSLDAAIQEFTEPERSVLARELRALLTLYADGSPSLGETRAPHDSRRPTEPDVALSADMPLAVPRRFGDYELLDKLGQGGMGEVFRARQLSAKRIVVLKIIRRDRLEDVSKEKRDQWVKRFEVEAKAAAQMEHENIVPVYQVGEIDGQHYYSMRFIAGRNLGELVKDEPLAPERAAAYLEKVARAVYHAHSRGILHRDLKPRNIIVDADDRPYVTDFGLAKWLLEEQIELTAQGALVGSPPYIAPEQVTDASRVTVAADVYSLGATLYHLLTGRPPFQAASVHETLRQVQYEDPVPPTRVRPGLSRDLETICLKCLAKDPRRRYASALELADDLHRYLQHQPVRARRPRAWERPVRWLKRHVAAVVLGGALIAAVAAILVQSRQAGPRDDSAKPAPLPVVTAPPQSEPPARPDPVVEQARALRDTARASAERGQLALRRGQVDAALDALDGAQAILEELVRSGLATQAEHVDLALLHANLGDLLEQSEGAAGHEQRSLQAVKHYLRARTLLDALGPVPSGDQILQRRLAKARSSTAEGQIGLGNCRAADTMLREALATQLLLATLWLAPADDFDALACTLGGLARLQLTRAKQVRTLGAWVFNNPTLGPWPVTRYAWARAAALPEARRVLADGRRLAEQAAVVHQSLRKRDPDAWPYRTHFNDDLGTLIGIALAQYDHAAAAATAERLPSVPPPGDRKARARAQAYAAEVLVQCAALAAEDPVLNRGAHLRIAAEYRRRAAELRDSASAAGWPDFGRAP